MQTARMRRTSSWRSICFYPGKNGGCTQILKIPKSECQDIWIRLPWHKWPKSWSRRPSRSCWAKSVWSSFGRTVMGKAIWENPFEVRLGEGIGNAYSYTVKKGYSYRCMWMTSNWLERNKKLIRCGEYSIRKSIWKKQHLSLIMYSSDALKDNVK